MFPLPPSADHAQSNDKEEECRGLGDLLRTATDNGRHKRVNVETVHSPVPVHVRRHVKPTGEQHIHKRVDVQAVHFIVVVHIADLEELEIPYTHVTDELECVDDVNSTYYNQIVMRDAVGAVDWQSSEQMLMEGIWYEKGIVVDHNSGPVRRGAGSCIFLHNWAGPENTTSGCTAMAPSALTEIVYWIDAEKDPILVQLTESLYGEYKVSWELPGPFTIDN